ncbi:MAG: TIGR03943 family protein [Microbacterium sp. SCN 70-27]|uniref:TIGR03943 family putative permease subunit n=1 Tax=unclassified Microbacterium TaxID=2609290 RepID=UPI00086A75BA|nr:MULTISPECIES: TIGR03943 family protein [unclassified Microbacterium]MBN9225179.1 TIGR03943 family protein [Microbacterium sp.]ODT28097.1 MAG: TIGR03943 family protein [Microbacterium sp. SCN 70-27]
MRDVRFTGARLLGVGLAAGLSAVTIALWTTGRLALYINPESTWFAVSMATIGLVGCAVSFALPRGAEDDHGHDHGEADDHAGHGHDHARHAGHGHDERRSVWATAATVTGGVLATGVVAAIVLTPPATLSAEIAMQRDTGTPPLFQGADTVALAATGDTASFGVGEWASVFATATNPEAFDGDQVTLTGFVTPGGDGFSLTRLVITHCVIDAQPASVAVASSDTYETGKWVTVTGTIRDDGGRLAIHATSIETVAEPKDPYEY